MLELSHSNYTYLREGCRTENEMGLLLDKIISDHRDHGALSVRLEKQITRLEKLLLKGSESPQDATGSSCDPRVI